MRVVGLVSLTLASALVLGVGCTRTHRRTDEAILAGPSSRIVVRCASEEECTSDPTAKHDETLCRTTSYRCRVDEVGAARTTPLVPEVETALSPLALDPVRSIAWLAWAGRLVGVATVASESPGSRVAPPPEMAGKMDNGESPKAALDGQVIVWRVELTTRFKLWHVATGRIVEIEVPVLPSPSAYDLDAYLTTCFDDAEGNASFTRVDVAATIEAGERVAITGVRPYTAEEMRTGDRNVKCRQAVRAAPTGE